MKTTKKITFKDRLLHLTGAFILLFSFMLGWMVMEYTAFVRTPLAIPAEGVVIVVNEGDSFHQVIRKLDRQGLVDNRLVWRWMAWYEDLASSIQRGEYFFPVGATPETLLQWMNAGKVMQHSLTIVEGWSFKQIKIAVQKNEAIDKTLPAYTDEAIMVAIGYPGQHPEGRFFPDTYWFPRHTTDVAFFQRAYELMSSQLQQVWMLRPDDFILDSMDQVLTLASVVEKETGLATERPLIAGVFLRRLQKGMRLQTDPTVIYGMGERFDGNIRRSDLRTDTPYNTYTRHGLPPTPIAMPGLAAMMAVVRPAQDKSLYFVSKGDGSHYFSETLKEHQRAVRGYQLTKKARDKK
ncbi:MAG: endolytic transglycosylase MltG [Gammaproteobacteria bacterium]|nr:endolytic transglycosylase MltG [Gammaproteobacteria bacterium]